MEPNNYFKSFIVEGIEKGPVGIKRGTIINQEDEPLALAFHSVVIGEKVI